MLKNEERNDVAGRREITVGIEVGRKVGDVGAFGGGEDDLVVSFRGDDVAAMLSTAVLAGHIPTAPAFFERRASSKGRGGWWG